MSKNQKESEKRLKGKGSKTPSPMESYRTEEVEYYVDTCLQAPFITNLPAFKPTTVEKTYSREEYERDPESGCLRYKGSFDPKTGRIVEPFLLYNSRHLQLSEKPSGASKKSPSK
jgi:hypothetical protein